ncbi:MAG: M42 family metallopeptidase [Candidatus Lokiarchaeota archaeon]|jgi:putative aminopeptidase FrvX|nr:M42 family metallopeptidase [Candidatus Lokiarchaeota archaeon]
MDIKSIKSLQEELSTLIGVSGHEDDVSSFILNLIERENLADKAWIDPLGNVLAIKKGTNGEDRILLDAHIDEIGFMVSHIEKSGFLRFVPIGGWDKRILLGQSVVVRSNLGERFHGIIGSKPPHLTSLNERKKIVEISDMYIDIGMNSIDEVKNNNITIGTTGTLFSQFLDFPNNMVRGKAFDDRTGVNVLIQILRLLKENLSFKGTVLFNFAVQEEVGGRGAITGAFKLEPTIAIAIENTTAADVPGIRDAEIPAYIGKGPAITVADISIICSPKVNERLVKNAELDNIPYQFKKPMYGGTDAGKIHITRAGVPSTVVSVPCRYIHSPTSLLKLDDILKTVHIIDAFIRNKADV